MEALISASGILDLASSVLGKGHSVVPLPMMCEELLAGHTSFAQTQLPPVLELVHSLRGWYGDPSCGQDPPVLGQGHGVDPLPLICGELLAAHMPVGQAQLPIVAHQQRLVYYPHHLRFGTRNMGSGE